MNKVLYSRNNLVYLLRQDISVHFPSSRKLQNKFLPAQRFIAAHEETQGNTVSRKDVAMGITGS